MTKQCPKCGYVRTGEELVPDTECPSCGVIYSKVPVPTKEVNQEVEEQEGVVVMEPAPVNEVKEPILIDGIPLEMEEPTPLPEPLPDQFVCLPDEYELCPKCKKMRKIIDPECPHCNATNMYFFAATAITFVVTIAVLRFLIANIPTSSNYSSARSDPGQSSIAYMMTEDFVRKRLKSPSSAEFPGVLDGRVDHVEYIGAGRYVIRSWVDAQNGLGATIRKDFNAVIENEGDQWNLLSLSFR